MSDLFMNKQRPRQRWHYHQQQPAAADAASSATTPSRTSRLTRAATPGATTIQRPHNEKTKPLDNDYLDNDTDDDSDDDDDVPQQPDNAEDDDDPLANILSLQLRKPSHWKWELTTSKSCSNIALPRIVLYDHKGNLLVDTPTGGKGSPEQVYKQADHEKPRPRDKTKKRPYNHQRAVTTNLTHSVRKALEKEFDGLQIQEVTSSNRTSVSGERKRPTTSLLTTPSSTSTNTTTLLRPHRSRKAIDFNTADLPDLSPRSSSLKGVRFSVEDEAKIPDFLPTPPSTTTPTSSSSGPREKRKYRRSHSSGRSSTRSESILERISHQKGRFSSPESEEEHEPEPGPRYFLRTDKAGTLMVHHEDSFNSQNSRRRRRTLKYPSSAESINKTESLHSLSLTPPAYHVASPTTPSEASTTASTRERRRKLLPVRRYLSDGNMLLNKKLSSSEEELVKPIIQKKQEDEVPEAPAQGGGCNCAHHRRYRRNETKAGAGAGTAGSVETPIIYRRYVRRRPATAPDYNYVDEYVEVFNTQRKPPAIWQPMTDEEVDKFIFCDFHREIEECKQYWKSRSPNASGRPVMPSEKPSPTPTVPQRITTTKSPTTGTIKTTARTTTTTTTTAKPTTIKTTARTTTTTTAEPTTELPTTTDSWGYLPDIEDDEDDMDVDIDVDDGGDEYDDGGHADEEDDKDKNPFNNPFSLFR